MIPFLLLLQTCFEVWFVLERQRLKEVIFSQPQADDEGWFLLVPLLLQ